MTRARRGKGPIARRLIKLLADAGWEVTTLIPVDGYWLHNHQDCYRWEAVAVPVVADQYNSRTSRVLSSYQTMTECVKAGAVEVTPSFDVYPLKKDGKP